MEFATSGATALIDDDARAITLAATGAARRDEFRKLLRDQILTPAYAAEGAWVLHAGLVSWRGETLLLLGDSGAGKTTGALHLLSAGEGGYGASERVLVFMRDGAPHALGVPESLTIFPGSLRGLPGFADLLEGASPPATGCASASSGSPATRSCRACAPTRWRARRASPASPSCATTATRRRTRRPRPSPTRRPGLPPAPHRPDHRRRRARRLARLA